MAGRRLITRVRTLPGAGARERYDALWEEVRRAATARGAHAWRFGSTRDPHRYIEFLEFSAEADPRAHPTLRDALLALDPLGTLEQEEWQERP